MRNKAIFFDRDGVLNKSIIINGQPFPPKNLSQLEMTEGISEVCQELKALNFKLFMITNQPDVARGKTPITIVNEINHYLKKKLNLDKVYCCFHDDPDGCSCRKPSPGMIQDACKEFSLDLSLSYLIGDRWKDIQAAKNAGVKSILIDYGHKEKVVKPDFNVYKIRDILQIIDS